MKQQYAIRTSETLRAVKTAMAFAPRNIWRCDPAMHKLGKATLKDKRNITCKQHKALGRLNVKMSRSL